VTGAASRVFDVTEGFGSPRLGPVPYEDAVRRVKVFCTRADSGWITYDLAAHHARQAGQFATVGHWSMLYAEALAGQVTISDIANFTHERRIQFAELVRRVPPEVGLAELDGQALDAVSDLCRFGFPGVWAPKITKVAALYRPHAVPVLDGYVALAYGFSRDGFSAYDGGARRERIGRVVRALAAQLRAPGRELLAELRADAAPGAGDPADQRPAAARHHHLDRARRPHPAPGQGGRPVAVRRDRGADPGRDRRSRHAVTRPAIGSPALMVYTEQDSLNFRMAGCRRYQGRTGATRLA
jgi:hypothetical protein